MNERGTVVRVTHVVIVLNVMLKARPFGVELFAALVAHEARVANVIDPRFCFITQLAKRVDDDTKHNCAGTRKAQIRHTHTRTNTSCTSEYQEHMKCYRCKHQT